VKFLLDVNALLAFCLREHAFHSRVARWMKHVSTQGGTGFATCAITEIGFLRVSSRQSVYGYPIQQAKSLLAQLKRTPGLDFAFISDDQGIEDLPNWVTGADQITDGHLSELARSHGALLATLDERIPGAFLIPE
jgi:uncharacterized protein